MALLADDPKDRVEQLLLITERLTALISLETARIEARQPPLEGAEADERNRLANAYRLELARIKHDPALVAGAPAPLLARLRAETEALQTLLAGHDRALSAVKAVVEGLVQSMAEEVARQRGGGGGYGAHGGVQNTSGPNPAIIDRSA